MRALLFDLDGTLTDPFEGITRSLKHALEEHGCADVAQDELRSCIGPPLRRSLATWLGDDHELVERAVASYRERYFDVGLYENIVYDGIPEALRELRGDGRRMFVVTSKVTPAARTIVEHFDLAEYFDAIYGTELGGRFDDKGDLIEHVLAEESLAPAGCLMIGDRLHDVEAARRNGLGTIGVTWGFGGEEELVECGADILCRSPAELPGVVRSRD